MAKALLGHLGNADPQALTEVRRLRRRVDDLESQLLRLQAENDALHAAVSREELLTVERATAAEPALA